MKTVYQIWALTTALSIYLKIPKYDSTVDTKKHITLVQIITKKFTDSLLKQVANHDKCKLSGVEKETFDKATPRLKGLKYGSDEYTAQLKSMKPALDHHYASEKHHPEHFTNGIAGMCLVDLCEMIFDWSASTLRHDNGDILNSIDINAKRFNISDDLKSILRNTVIDLQIGAKVPTNK